MNALNRSALTAGTNILTVTPDAAWLRTRELLGDLYHASYRYKLERVESRDGGTFLFLSTWTESTKGTNGRFVYTGSVSLKTGAVELTRKSAFPAHATRVRIADRVLRCMFTEGGAVKIAATGWVVELEGAEVVTPF